MLLKQLAKDSSIYGGADFLTKMLAFFAFPFIAAQLSPKAFGVLEIIITVTALLGLVVNCGLNNAVQRFYWDKETTPAIQPVIVTSGLCVQLGIGIFAVLLGVAAIPFVLPLMQANGWPLTWVALVSAFLVMTLTQWNQYALDVVRLHFAPWRFFGLALTSRSVSMGMGLITVVVLGMGIDGLLAAQAVVLALVLPVALWLIRKDFRPGCLQKRWIKELVRFGHPFIYSGLAYWLFGSMDRWMLASMTSVDEVGIYSVAFRFASLVLLVSAAFGQAWSPVAIKIRTDHPDKYRTIYGQVLLLLFFVMLVVGGGVALFSGEFFGLVMPTEYLPSALPLSILCFGIVLQATQQVTAVGISLEKKTHLFARLTWFAAFVNFGLNYWLIPLCGAVGAAIATFGAYLVLTTSFLISTQKLHPLALHWRKLSVLVILGCCVGTVAILWNTHEWSWAKVAAKLALCMGCLGVVWLFDVACVKSNSVRFAK